MNEDADTVAGVLSILASDALNGITPNDSRLLARLTALGLSRAAIESELKQARAYYIWRATRLLDAVEGDRAAA